MPILLVGKRPHINMKLVPREPIYFRCKLRCMVNLGFKIMHFKTGFLLGVFYGTIGCTISLDFYLPL